MLLDDRDARPGVKFADAELIGIPHRVVIGERGLAKGELEYRHRRDSESRDLKREEVLNLLKESADKLMILMLYMMSLRYMTLGRTLSAVCCFGAALACAAEPAGPGAARSPAQAASDSPSFTDRFDAEVWLTDMSGRLARQVKIPKSASNC